MSQTKKYKIQIIFAMIILSCFFMFGCKHETPVEDIYFNLNQGEQIVLFVNQKLELKDYVVVTPSYATNKKYSITSYNEEVVRVENDSLIAVKEGQAVVKVVSKDNSLKEAMMTVVVKSTQEQLNAPLNLTYNNQLHSFAFDPVTYASSYTIKINGEEFELGNSLSFDINNYAGKKFDGLIVAQVKANAPKYSFALKSSDYSAEMKIYQAGEVENLKVEGGVATFVKYSATNKHNVYLDDNLLVNNLEDNFISLKSIDESYAGKTIELKVQAVVSEEIKQQYGNDVEYFNSNIKKSIVYVLDAPNISISGSTLSWQNIAHSAGYKLLIDGELKVNVNQNYFDLKNLSDYDDIFVPNVERHVKVLQVLSDNSVGVAQTTKENFIKLKRLNSVSISCDGSDLKWTDIDNVSVYSIDMIGENGSLNSSTNLTQLSMSKYEAGNYIAKITAVAQTEAIDGVYFLASKTVEKQFIKHGTLNAYIENYVLKIENLEDGVASIDYDEKAFDRATSTEYDFHDTITGVGNAVTTYSLVKKVFNSGNRSMVLKRIGDANSIDSDEFKIEFTQLEKIDQIIITNHEAVVQRSEINMPASIKLVTSGSKIEDIVVYQTRYKYNSENSSVEDYLPASNDYVTKVFVEGDGSATFSYRENGELVSCCQVEFEVLKAPSNFVVDKITADLSFDNISNSYNVYEIGSANPITINSNVYQEITLNEGCAASYQVRSLGNGSSTLNSALSDVVTISRLKTPMLMFNNTNHHISKKDDNEVGVAGYLFTHNGEVNNAYDFDNEDAEIELKGTNNVFTLTALATDGDENNFYINSFPYQLTLNQITNTVSMSLNGLQNDLIISPTGHDEQFDLVLEFGLNNGTDSYINSFKTKFDETTGEYVLSNGLEDESEIVLKYSYFESNYVIKLIDENYNAIIEDLNNEFSVKVRFIKSSTGNDILINSEFSDIQTFSLNRINEDTKITVNTNNQIVLTTNHMQEFALVGVVMVSDNHGYVVTSNGKGKLVCSKEILNGQTQEMSITVSLSYTYSRVENQSIYCIDILDRNNVMIIPAESNYFDIKVKYSFMHDGVETDLDSEYCEEKTINLQPKTIISRDGQNLKINNVRETYTYLNYYLLVNNYPLELNDSAVNENMHIVVDVEDIYSRTPKAYIKDINLVEVVVKNDAENTDENPVISIKSGSILIKKTETVDLGIYKYNNNEDGKQNNSSVITFNTYETDYSKEYVVEIQHNGQKVFSKHYFDSDALNGVVEFRVDEISELEDLSGDIQIYVYVLTSGKYNDEDGEIEVFNSFNSNEINLNKIPAPTGLKVSDSVLTFDAVANSVGYEVYEKTGTGFVKLNTALLTTNMFNIANMNGVKTLVVKAISVAYSYTNSSYSEMITINKLAQPTISVEKGKFKIGLNATLISLLTNDKITITPEIINNSSEKVTIDVNNLDGEELKLDLISMSLIAEPYLFLSYNNASLQSEKLIFKIKIEQTEAINGVFYLNTDPFEMDCHGLFEPSEIRKTTNENNFVEMISWTPSAKNTIQNQPLNVGYIFKIEYSGSDKVFYSDDQSLKYYDSVNKKYVSYSEFIQSPSTMFPAGYGLKEDGTFEVEFGAGTYKLSVQTVPLNVVDGFNLLSSKYSTCCEFEIMPSSTLSVVDGEVSWETQPKADYYLVTIYDSEGDTVFVDKTNDSKYGFNNTNLKSMEGVYSVSVKSISTKEDTLNSDESDVIFVYRLPQANSITIDDGHLVLSATKYFKKAEVSIWNKIGNVVYKITYDNTNYCYENLANLKISNWENFENHEEINAISKFEIELDGNLNILSGADYEFSVQLFGNTSYNLGLINSIKKENLSNLTAAKLKPNVAEVSLGVVQFMPDDNYATISIDGVYTPSIRLNYQFNDATSSNFWNKTVVYQIAVEPLTSENFIYAVDYYSFITAIKNGDIESNEYSMLTGAYGLYAYVKYPYNDNGTVKNLYFNVFKNNQINLRDYDLLLYYGMKQEMVSGANNFKYISPEEYEIEPSVTEIDLSKGGTFTISVKMLGGDDFEFETIQKGYITSETKTLNPIIRYGVNSLSSYEGKVQFNSLIQVHNSEIIDYPIYKINVKSYDGSNLKTFYFYHTTEADAKYIAERHDQDNFEQAEFIKVENGASDDLILFDMSKYFLAGSYRLSIRTLAGLGVGEKDEKDYLINALEPSKEYTFQKLSDTEFYVNNSILEFAQSYVVNDGQKVYYKNYEITIFEHATNKTYFYNLNESTEGVAIDESRHVVKYVLPASINAQILETQASATVISDGGQEFSVKVRAIASAEDNYILNGTYKQNNNQDVMFKFAKSLGVNDLRIENGILKWKVVEENIPQTTIIKVSFLDENSKVKTLKDILVDDLNKYEINGVYQYHYYQFTDGQYDLATTGSTQIKHKILRNYDDVQKEEIVIYNISACTQGISIGEQNVINSNISSISTTTRLDTVKVETIKTVDGVLVWDIVDKAVGYEVFVVGDKEYKFTTTQASINFLEEKYQIDEGYYYIQIRALGDKELISMISSFDGATNFIQLKRVDYATVKIEKNKIVWDAVENADAYRILFNFTGLENPIETISTQPEFIVPETTQGKFVITISAISVGEGKEFNGKSIEFESSKEVPVQVDKFEFDNVNNRFMIDVKDSNFLDGDTLQILYDFAMYSENGKEKAETNIITIEKWQRNSFEKIDDETYRYYYPLTIMGEYKSISVKVVKREQFLQMQQL